MQNDSEWPIKAEALSTGVCADWKEQLEAIACVVHASDREPEHVLVLEAVRQCRDSGMAIANAMCAFPHGRALVESAHAHAHEVQRAAGHGKAASAAANDLSSELNALGTWGADIEVLNTLNIAPLLQAMASLNDSLVPKLSEAAKCDLLKIVPEQVKSILKQCMCGCQAIASAMVGEGTTSELFPYLPVSTD